MPTELETVSNAELLQNRQHATLTLVQEGEGKEREGN